MTDLRLTITATMAELNTGAGILAKRFNGKGRLFATMLATGVGAMVASIGAGVLLGVAPVTSGLVGAYGALGAIGAYALAVSLNRRRYVAMLDTSAIRGKPYPLVLAPDGVTLPERHFGWGDFSGVQRYKDMTVLTSSAADGIVIPDRDLPAGTTPDHLARMIADWRTP